MKMKKMVLVVMAVIMVTGLVFADEKFGVVIYPAAKPDEATAKFLKESLKVEGAAFRTNDSAAKVMEFYKKQPGTKLVDAAAEGGMLRKGNVDITVQNPWQDMKTGKKMTDTLISIVKQGK